VDPGVVIIVDPFRLHECMKLLNARSDSSSIISLQPHLSAGKHIEIVEELYWPRCHHVISIVNFVLFD